MYILPPPRITLKKWSDMIETRVMQKVSLTNEDILTEQEEFLLIIRCYFHPDSKGKILPIVDELEFLC